MSALQRIREMCHWNLMPTAELSEILAPLAEPLKMQCSELRSQIIKELCSTISTVADALKRARLSSLTALPASYHFVLVQTISSPLAC